MACPAGCFVARGKINPAAGQRAVVLGPLSAILWKLTGATLDPLLSQLVG